MGDLDNDGVRRHIRERHPVPFSEPMVIDPDGSIRGQATSVFVPPPNYPERVFCATEYTPRAQPLTEILGS